MKRQPVDTMHPSAIIHDNNHALFGNIVTFHIPAGATIS